MRWSNVWVIFQREVRDQLRDRRTLFMIFILPLLLYPILVFSIVSLRSAFEQKTRTVVLVGAENLPPNPPLLNKEGNGFLPELFDQPTEARRLEVLPEKASGAWSSSETIREGIRDGRIHAVVSVPPDLKKQIDETSASAVRLPITYDSTDEPSQITYLRVREVLSRWNDAIVRQRLLKDNKSESYVSPLATKAVNVATPEETGGSVWALIFPFLLVLMSLTGAFYPAIDLCAGEKERGTMETLLVSPAFRGEIVMGKFLTVVLASMTTALLNLLSMGLTGFQLARTYGAMSQPGSGARAMAFAPPSLVSICWMLVLLVPLAVFFSALCLALAVLAKSMKEGQYYLTPLYLVSLPLIFLTLAPEIELNFFFSIVPVTGVSLLLRALIKGDYGQAIRFFLPVILTTVVYGLLALRWAVDQFRREDVLFREAERFDLRDWMKHLIRDKEPTPNAGGATFCFAAMLCLAYYLVQALSNSTSPLLGMALGHLGFILAPPLVLAFVFTSDPKRTLRLNPPKAGHLAIAVGLAFALNPSVRELSAFVEQVMPLSQDLREMLAKMLGASPSIGVAILLFAVMPAITEEVAFRGFILTGLGQSYSTRAAVAISALLFGILHVLISLSQQFLPATLLGLILGLIAVRTNSLYPGMAFHFVNNALAVLTDAWLKLPAPTSGVGWFFRSAEDGLYHLPIVGLSAAISGVLIYRLASHVGKTVDKPPEPQAALN